MSGIVHSCLYHLIEGEAGSCLLVLYAHVDVVGEAFCHPVVMFGQVRIAGDLAVTKTGQG